MKKSILSVALLIAMFISIIAPVSVFAAPADLKSYFEAKNIAAIVAQHGYDRVYVPTNIQVREHTIAGNTSYQNDPLILAIPYGNPANSRTFDFIAKLDMSPVRDAFEQYYGAATLLINSDTEKTPEQKTALLADLAAVPVTGEFTVVIEYESGLDVTNTGFLGLSSMDGFKIKNTSGEYIDYAENNNVYYEVSRVPGTNGINWNTITITIKVKAPNGGTLTGGDLAANLDTYLADLALECQGVAPGEFFKTYKVKGSVTGNTQLGETPNILANIIYNAYQEGSADKTTPVAEREVCVTQLPPQSIGGSSTQNKANVAFDVGGDTALIPAQTVAVGEMFDVDAVEIPTKLGYVFDGFYYNKDYTDKAEGKIKITKNIILYARWLKAEAPDVLNSEKHFAYIAGYPNYEIRPFDNISREEVATIFYRILKKEKQQEFYAPTNSFPDVEDTRWSNDAISTIANGGYVVGYEDGTFRPEEYITRAEFVTIVARFYDTLVERGTPYNDIGGHWAEKYILTAASQGWIDGYNDGSFRPDEYITRADVIRIVNRLLVRCVNAEGLHADTRQWIDNYEESEYYYDILEATNSHDYERQADGYHETWPALLEENLIIDETFYEN